MNKPFSKKSKFYFTEWASTQLLFLFFCAIIIAVCYWAYVSKISVVSVAEGEVVPSGQIKTVQHLEGGIIKEILVQEGQRIKKDEKLSNKLSKNSYFKIKNFSWENTFKKYTKII